MTSELSDLRPELSGLLSEIASGLAVSPSGSWESPGGFSALVRLATVALLIARPILAWLFMPPVVPARGNMGVVRRGALL